MIKESTKTTSLEKEYAKQRKIDENSFLMYEKTIKESEEHYRDDVDANGNKRFSEEKAKELIESLRIEQEKVVRDYVMHGGNEEDIRALAKKRRKTYRPKIQTEDLSGTLFNEIKTTVKEPTHTVLNTRDNRLDTLPKGFDNVAYDLIPLPSNGEAYKSKIDRLPVASLTAEDENAIVNPNLYRDNLVLDVILKNKILSGIDQADLLEGDRDAIILYLRSDGYGYEYPITATDDITGKQFDTVVDLRDIHYKEFKLKGDENGWFDFELPLSKSKIKFKFPTHRDTLDLAKIEEMEKKYMIKFRLNDFVDRMSEFVDVDNDLEREKKRKVRDAIKTIEAWADSYNDEDAIDITNAITNRMEMCVMEVDGNRDRNFIHNFIRNMKVRDSSALRKYINENEPGLDYNLTIQRPESLGGGSMNLFLQLDQFVFLNIA